jgi:predicted dehydrogenase
MQQPSRREFLKAAAAGTVAASGSPHLSGVLDARQQTSGSGVQAVWLGLIDAGGQGMSDTRTAPRVPATKLTAVADIYDGSLARATELWGPDVFTTRDYRDLLSGSDIDAVIVATPDRFEGHPITWDPETMRRHA